MLEALKSLFQVPQACITVAWCGKTYSAYTRVHAKTTVLAAILRGRLIRESPYTRVYTVVPSSMTVKHFHYALVSHALRIMMTSACLIACVVTLIVHWIQLHRIYTYSAKSVNIQVLNPIKRTPLLQRNGSQGPHPFKAQHKHCIYKHFMIHIPNITVYTLMHCYIGHFWFPSRIISTISTYQNKSI